MIASEAANVPLLGAWSVAPAVRRGRGPRRTLGIAVSLFLHGALLAAATQIVWRQIEPLPPPHTDFVWLGEWLPAPPAEVAPPVELAPPAPTEAPAATSEPARALEAETDAEPVRAASTAAPTPAAPAPSPGAASAATGTATAPLSVRNPDWAEERRRAVAAVAAEVARAGEFREPTLEQLMRPRERERMVIPDVTIFDLGSRGGTHRGALTPGQARTKFGRMVSEFCNALTGGFGFFGLGVCARAENRPTGLYPEVLPEWLKLMPVCTDAPTAPLLANSFPTARCRLVPKQTEEPLSGR